MKPTLIIILTDDALLWRHSNHPSSAFEEMPLRGEKPAAILQGLDNYLQNYHGIKSVRLYLHVSHHQFSHFSLESLSWIGRLQFRRQQLLLAQKESCCVGFQRSSAEGHPFYSFLTLPLFPHLEMLFKWLKNSGLPLSGLYSLPVFLHHKALALQAKSAVGSSWMLFLITPPHISPFFLLTRETQIVFAKISPDGASLAKEFQHIHMLAKSYAKDMPVGLLHWGELSPLTNFVRHYPFSFLGAEHFSCIGGKRTSHGSFQHSPLKCFQRLWWGVGFLQKWSYGALGLLALCYGAIALWQQHLYQEVLVWESKKPFAEGTFLPQDFDVKKALLQLHDTYPSAPLPAAWEMVHRVLAYLDMPLYALDWRASSDFWEAHITIDAPEVIEDTFEHLQKMFPSLHFAILKNPSFADVSQPYAAPRSQQGEAPPRLTFSLREKRYRHEKHKKLL